MNTSVKGKIILKNDTIYVSEKFAKRELVIETLDIYPQQILIQFTQDKCSLLDTVNIGDEVECFVNIRGKSWTNPQGETKYFNTLDAWRIDTGVANPNNSAPIEKQSAMAPNPDWEQPFVPGQAVNDVEDDTLPF